MVRPILSKWHPQASKITFWFPTCFVFFVIASILFSILYKWEVLVPLLCYVSLIFFDSSFKNKSFYIGSLTVVALFIQFFGYGLAFFKINILYSFIKERSTEAVS